ncbi:MAG: amino acid ABC transporter ATP-binding/permease protein, partial [Lachnospiraceae bacterium]
MRNEQKNRNALQVMLGLIGMVKPLLGIMLIAILMGCIGNLMATFITILGSIGIGAVAGFFAEVRLTPLFVLIVLFAVCRGILRYAEQASNHYIAFKLLARIRHKVFAALRRLAPAKLDGSGKGNLISIITSDIELLEVFYAHTISPIAIAVITSLVMSLYIGHFHWTLGVLAGIFYLLVGVAVPLINGRLGQEYGRKYRALYGKLNTTVLDNLYGLGEILQYQQQEKRMEKMNAYTEELEDVNCTLKKQEAAQKIVTDSIILAAGILMLLAGSMLFHKGILHAGEVLVCTTAMMSSFGPTAALSALSNNLNQTLASGNRVLNLLAEEPLVEDIQNGVQVSAGDITVDHVTFTYRNEKENREVLQDFSLTFKENKIHGILGKSGCGKSTLLKLLMRFYETETGTICYGGQDVGGIDTAALRSHISYVTQETFLFQDTIENNIKVAREDATREEVIEAAKKASIHEFIASLPQGYDTRLSELGESVSGGERQRIGLARAFLHQAKVILLDEPTSNIDSLNEGIILQSLER